MKLVNKKSGEKRCWAKNILGQKIVRPEQIHKIFCPTKFGIKRIGLTKNQVKEEKNGPKECCVPKDMILETFEYKKIVTPKKVFV